MRKKDSNTVSLQNAFGDWLDNNRMQDRYKETFVVAFWKEMMGDTIASRTKHIYVKDGVLFIVIESSSLRNELQMTKTKILEILEKNQPGVIKEIVFR